LVRPFYGGHQNENPAQLRIRAGSQETLTGAGFLGEGLHGGKHLRASNYSSRNVRANAHGFRNFRARTGRRLLRQRGRLRGSMGEWPLSSTHKIAADAIKLAIAPPKVPSPRCDLPARAARCLMRAAVQPATTVVTYRQRGGWYSSSRLRWAHQTKP